MWIYFSFSIFIIKIIIIFIYDIRILINLKTGNFKNNLKFKMSKYVKQIYIFCIKYFTFREKWVMTW